MALAAMDASVALELALNDIRERERRQKAAAEAKVAKYYLQEQYNSSSGSSNWDELESAVRGLEYSIEAYGAEDLSVSWQVVNPRAFTPKREDIHALFERIMTNHYKAVEDDPADLQIYANCLTIFEKDYKCQILENPGGALSWNYPVRMIIPERAKEDLIKVERPTRSAAAKKIYDPILPEGPAFQEFCQMAKQAAIARCRNRFPVPVILCNGKYVCRSGTLAVRKGVAFGVMTQPDEPQGRESFDNPFFYIWGGIRNIAQRGKRIIDRIRNAFKVLLATSMDDIKDLDVKILQLLQIGIICDLMVEDRKTHTGLSVGSSEKVNMRKYGIFRTMSIPYPGCHFFTRYSLAQRNGKGLRYDWHAHDVTSALRIAYEEAQMPTSFKVQWNKYREWDLILLTKNYLKAMLYYVYHEDRESLLVHCISGWDRTPLFISLLRMTLWCDNQIHQNLTAKEMLYLTLAYDWYLFGHDLPTRLRRREEIMHFCFNFLPILVDYDFHDEGLLPPGVKRARTIPRTTRINALVKNFMEVYDRKVQLD